MKLIDDWWRKMWRLASTRLALVAGFVTAYFIANPHELQAIISAIPDQWRPFVAPLIGMIVTGTAAASRVIQFKASKQETE